MLLALNPNAISPPAQTGTLVRQPTKLHSSSLEQVQDVHEQPVPLTEKSGMHGHEDVLAKNGDVSERRQAFGDPLGLYGRYEGQINQAKPQSALLPILGASSAALLGASAPAFGADIFQISQPALDPATFQPVCPASDGFYRFAQTLVVATVGPESFKEYSPLIAGGLLRVRLELCVVESFVYEAIIPFINEKGLSWVLPLHETVETFLAGVIFAVAASFIFIGSTKLITVIFTFADFFFGFPIRIFGGIGWRGLEDKAIEMNKAEREDLGIQEKERPWWRGPAPRESPPLEDVFKANSGTLPEQVKFFLWGSLLGVGVASRTVKEIVEALDVFVGRYLLLSAVAYVGIKLIHFKFFDPFP